MSDVDLLLILPLLVTGGLCVTAVLKGKDHFAALFGTATMFIGAAVLLKGLLS